MSLIRCHDCGDNIDSDAEPECFWIAGFGYREWIDAMCFDCREEYEDENE
jgi:hypothetical protein